MCKQIPPAAHLIKSFPGKIAYGNKKNAKVPYGKSFGKSPPTPGEGLWVKLNKHDIHVIFPPRDLCFTFLHSRKPYGVRPHCLNDLALSAPVLQKPPKTVKTL